MKKVYSKRISKHPPKGGSATSAKTDEMRFLKGTLGTLLLSLAVGGGLLVLSSLVLSFVADPLSLVLITGILCAAVTAFVGGYFATRIYGLSALSGGLFNGILLTAISLLLSLLFAKNAASYATGYSASISALLHMGTIGLSIGGAFVGSRTPSSNRKKRRKKR